YNGLNRPSDIQKFIDEGYDRRLIETLFTQKTSRDVKKRYHSVKNNTSRMLRDWKKGRTLMEIADQYAFPPILTAMFIFLEEGISRKQFWEFVRDPELLDSAETAEEVRDAVKNDYVYSPWADELQKERGRWGEDLLQGWLDSQEISYRTENDLRGGEGQKTPDCLLDEPMLYMGKKICWVESKASFGDNVEFRFNSRKQLIPYTKLFGPGVVVYWTGCLDDMECPEDVYITDMSVLDVRLEKIRD
ncbi:MAG: C15orf41 family protein, partial [Candidatus Methanoplasma sp.]|nr:C15orf41 family protein [Candidatus Methanoplasma sp.]